MNKLWQDQDISLLTASLEERGEALSIIIGENGSGKSFLLNEIAKNATQQGRKTVLISGTIEHRFSPRSKRADKTLVNQSTRTPNKVLRKIISNSFADYGLHGSLWPSRKMEEKRFQVGTALESVGFEPYLGIMVKFAVFSEEKFAAFMDSLPKIDPSQTSQSFNKPLAPFSGATSVWDCIIDEAIEAGYVEVEIRKPALGRPSRILKKVSQNQPTKLPHLRSTLEDCISFRHWNFAFYYVIGEFGDKSVFSFKRRAWTAYKKAFPYAKSNAGARASASRLMKASHIQAAIQWEFAMVMDRLKISGRSPQTTSEIWFTLLDHRSYRARLAPWWYRQQWLDAQSEGET